MAEARERRPALVFSGGGAKGAFEVGVLRALAEGASPATGYRPLDARIFTGTSVGAYNATFLAAQGGAPLLAAARRLERVWLSLIAGRPELGGNGIFRLRGWPGKAMPGRRWYVEAGRLMADTAYLSRAAATTGLRALLHGRWGMGALLRSVDVSELFDLSPFHRLLAASIDLQALAAGPASLNLTATNFITGQARHFSKEEITGRYGLATILASAALPALFPMVSIEEVPYIDGGASDNTPILPALLLGGDTLHVIYLSPLLEDLPLHRWPGTTEVLHRLSHLLVDRQSYDCLWCLPRLNSIIRRATRQIAGRARVSSAIRGLDNWHRDPLLRRLEAFAMRLPRGGIELHRYRPRDDLGGATKLLDMSPEYIGQCLEAGYHSAIDHDCAADGCVLPGHEEISP